MRWLSQFLVDGFMMVPLLTMGEALGWPWWGRLLASCSTVVGVRAAARQEARSCQSQGHAEEEK